MANVKRAALVKTRERRLALDRDRESRDSRVEQAAARVFLGVEQRDAAQRAVLHANVGIGKALLELLAEQIAVEDVAQLCDLDTSEVRRLVRLPALAGGSAEAARFYAAVPAGAVDGTASMGGAGPATVTQLRCRPPSDTNVDAVAVAVPATVAGGAGAERRAE